MNRLYHSVVYFLIASAGLITPPGYSYAQAPKPLVSPTPSSETRKNSANSNSIDPEVAQKRSIAIGSLSTLSIEARSYSDEPLRARVQARIADALWDHDQENARSLFRRAWEAAETIETQSQPVPASVPGRMSANRPASSGRPRTNLRAEVLKLAAARDHALGEEFLKRLTASAKENGSELNGNSRPSEAEIRERLRIANEFLEADNIERALQFADPALLAVTTPTISFLVELRLKNKASADQRFASLLMRAAADPEADANTVSLLTTYAFTPWIYLAVSPEGIPSSNSYSVRATPDLEPRLRAQALTVCANILLRPFAQIDQSSAGRAGTYFIASRLLPLFEQYAPDLAPAISSQLRALGPEAARSARNAGERSLNRGMTPESAGVNVPDDLKDRLDRARNTDERDRAYAFAAMGSAQAGNPSALEFVNKIEDLDTRKGIRSFVDYSLIGGYLQKKEVDEAIRIARKSEIPHSLRCSALTKAAQILAPTDRVRANELLEEALSEARRTDAGTNERAYALVHLLAQFIKTNRVRAWELIGETVKAGNAAPNFTGENGHTRLRLEGKFSIEMGSELATPTDLSESFAALAREDFYQALDVAGSYSGEAPRALATIAVARATIEDKRQPK